METYQIRPLFEDECATGELGQAMTQQVQLLLRQQLEEEKTLFEQPSLLTHLHTSDETIQRLVDHWQVEPSVSVFVAVCNQSIWAFLAAQLKNDIYNNQDVISGEVLAVFVSPSQRKKGLGTALLSHAESWFKANKAYAVNVSWLKGNDPSSSLYKKFGFEPVYSTGRKIL
ncbi:MAG: GNAT family N-acetyltransferase [Agarilytica sp.]